MWGKKTAVVQTPIHRSTLTGKQGVLSPAAKCTDEGQLRHEFITGWRQFSAKGKYATCRVQDEAKGKCSVLTKPLTGENAIVWGIWNTRNGKKRQMMTYVSAISQGAKTNKLIHNCILFMYTITLSLLLNKTHLYGIRQDRFILTQLVIFTCMRLFSLIWLPLRVSV